MLRALDEGGTSFDALYVNVNGESGYFDRSLAVYGQRGPALPAVRDADPPRPVHEPLDLHLPALPAAAAARPVLMSAPGPDPTLGQHGLRDDAVRVDRRPRLGAHPLRATAGTREDPQVLLAGDIGRLGAARRTPCLPVGAQTQTDWHGQDSTVRAAIGGVSIGPIVSRSGAREPARKINLSAG